MRLYMIFAIILVAIQILNSHATVHNSRLNFFDIDLLRYAAGEKKGNVMLSPASIKSTLAIILEGAEGTTASELKSALRVSPEKEDFRYELGSFVKSLQAHSPNVLLQSSSALFLSKKLKLKKDFEMMVERLYHSEISKLDFSNPKSAVDLVNAWVNAKTKGLIPTIVDEVHVPPTAEMVIANAIYFKGSWKHGFNPKLTHGDCFYHNGDCTNVAMMDLQAELKYAFIDDLRAHALELPYRGDRYSMFLLVPQDRDSGMVLLRDLPYVGLPQILDIMYPTDVVLTMPKFEVDYNEDLVGALKSMDITSLFSDSANLTGIYESGDALHVNSIYHSVHVKVDEEGTVAAAATASLIVPLINNQVQLRIDRPFLFFIRDNKMGLNLFEGKIEEPTKYVDITMKEKPKAPEKPVPIEPFNTLATSSPPPPSLQSFHEANPNYDHGGPYQPPLYQDYPSKNTVKPSDNRPDPSEVTKEHTMIQKDKTSTSKDPTSSTSDPITSEPNESHSAKTNKNDSHENQHSKKSSGITGFFKRIGSYFDI